MDATADMNNNVERGLEAEAELAGRMEAEISDASEVKRGNNKQVCAPY
jgi:hypothetical protein